MEIAELEPQLEALHPQGFAWALTCCGGNREEAEEVVQSVYLAIFEGRARFGGRSALRTWLFAVIRRTAAGLRRRAMVRRGLRLEWGTDQLRSQPEPPPDESLERSELASRVRRAMAELSRRQRQVLELVFFHELSVREAGEVLGLSVGSARTHYARGKAELLRRFNEESPA